MGVDAARYLLSFFVVALHAMPQGPTDAAVWPEAISIVTRAAVPFFFIASGYFLKPRRTAHPDMVTRPLVRLLPVFAFWVLAYVLLAMALGRDAGIRLRDLPGGGPGFHLWFLPALGFGLAAVSMSLALAGERLTAAWCLALAAVGLVSSSYHDLLFGDATSRRGGLMIAPCLVLLGSAIRRRNLSMSVPFAVTLVLAALLLVFAEELAISRLAAAPFTSHDFTVSTMLYGGAVFLLSLALPESRLLKRVAVLGGISLGVYAAHMAFLWILFGHFANDNWAGAMLIALLAFLGATLVSLVAARIPVLRRVTS